MKKRLLVVNAHDLDIHLYRHINDFSSSMLRQCSWFLVVTMFVHGFNRTVLSFRLDMAGMFELPLTFAGVVIVTGANAGG